MKLLRVKAIIGYNASLAYISWRMPCDETGPHSAEDFASFFKDKADGVRASTSSTPIYDVPLRATPTLAEWTPVSPDETENSQRSREQNVRP